MTGFLAAFPGVAWDARVVRLRVGLAPVDAIDPAPGPPGAPPGLAVHLEHVPLPHAVPRAPDDAIGLPALRRSPAGRFSIAFGARATDEPDRLSVRIVDPERRYVPRRLSLPVPDLAAVLAAEAADTPLPRGCVAAVYPGARYGVPAGATVVRGRVTFGAGGPPVPWTRVTAVSTPGQAAPWRAHGDRDGEFVLFIGPLTTVEAKREQPDVAVTVTVHARPLPPDGTPVGPPARSRADPLWHLPVEEVGALGVPDAVADGTTLPPGYTATTSAIVTCRRGGRTRPAPFVLP